MTDGARLLGATADASVNQKTAGERAVLSAHDVYMLVMRECHVKGRLMTGGFLALVKKVRRIWKGKSLAVVWRWAYVTDRADLRRLPREELFTMTRHTRIVFWVFRHIRESVGLRPNLIPISGRERMAR